jgi:hypothetical protein
MLRGRGKVEKKVKWMLGRTQPSFEVTQNLSDCLAMPSEINKRPDTAGNLT